MVEAKATALRFAHEIVQWVERLADAFGDIEGGRSVSQTWDSLTEIRYVASRLFMMLLILNIYHIIRRKLINDIFAWVNRMLVGYIGFLLRLDHLNVLSHTQNGGLTDRISANDEILRFQTRFTQATMRFEVCNSLNTKF